MDLNIKKRPLIYKPPHTSKDNIIDVTDDYIIIHKPSGILSVPGRLAEHNDSLFTRLCAYYPECLVVHRLDLETSGLMIFARHQKSQRDLNNQFAAREVQKTYVARVFGSPVPEKGVIEAPLICDWPNRPLQIIDFEKGKHARTRYKTIQRGKEYSLVELFPETGRSHQLRVHMQSIGHPILGDPLYAHEKAYLLSDRLDLHAQSLSFKSLNQEIKTYVDRNSFMKES